MDWILETCIVWIQRFLPFWKQILLFLLCINFILKSFFSFNCKSLWSNFCSVFSSFRGFIRFEANITSCCFSLPFLVWIKWAQVEVPLQINSSSLWKVSKVFKLWTLLWNCFTLFLKCQVKCSAKKDHRIKFISLKLSFQLFYFL